MMLETPAEKLRMRPTDAYPKIYGVLMDWPLPGGQTATVVSLCDGSASIYTTSDFGILGGIGHETVRNAATNFVKTAQALYEDGVPTTDFSYPTADHTRFYLLGFSGVRVIDTEIASLLKPSAKYSDLWTAGQNVLTELRKITEKPAK